MFYDLRSGKGDDKKKMFDFLIAHGSNINDKAKYDHTMLHASAITGLKFLQIDDSRDTSD